MASCDSKLDATEEKNSFNMTIKHTIVYLFYKVFIILEVCVYFYASKVEGVVVEKNLTN